jgi:hypothetical protein
MSVAAFRAWGQDRPLSDSFNTEVDASEGSIEALYNFFPSKVRPDELDELGDLPPARQIAKDRYDLAGESLGTALQRLLDPPHGGVSYLFQDQLGTILELARLRTDARLDMAESDEERIEALSSEIAHARALLDLLREFQRLGVNNVRPSDIRELDLYRLGLEHRLAVLTQRAPAEPGLPSAPSDPRLPEGEPDPAPADPEPEPEPEEADDDGGGIGLLFESDFVRGNLTPPEEVGSLPTREELARERYELAGKVLRSLFQGFLEPPRSDGSPTFGDRLMPVLEWSRRRMDARLDLAGSDEERIEVLRREIAHTRALLKTLKGLSRGSSSSISAEQVLEVDQYRLELEWRLAGLLPD